MLSLGTLALTALIGYSIHAQNMPAFLIGLIGLGLWMLMTVCFDAEQRQQKKHQQDC